MSPEPQPRDDERRGRTYRSTPSAKQVRFPARRSKVRERSKGSQKRENASLKQQTLTQMDFVSSFSFSEDLVALSDDDVSDGTAHGQDKPVVLQDTSEAEAQLEERLQEETRGSTLVIQDSLASPGDSLSAQVSPLRLRPIQLRDVISSSPSRVRIMGQSDTVKASPRRRAHWSRDLERSKRLKSSQEDDMSSPTRIRPPTKDIDDREIPDSEEEYEELELQEDDGLIQQDTFATGLETQLALEELASIEYPERDDQERQQEQELEKDTETNQLLASTPPSPAFTSPRSSSNGKSVPPIEAIDHLPTTKASSSRPPTISPPSPNSTFKSHHQLEPSQGRHDPVFESQRVPLHVLQSFTPVSARTDILLPTPSKVLDSLVDGSVTFLHLTYRVPELVRRFWLLDQETLRYMACVQPSKRNGLGWDYHADQVYELNNPVDERDMQEEGWVTGPIRRYIYLPPAIVGQLLWNLRCATFDHAGLEDDDENSQAKSNVESESSMPSQPAAHSGSCTIHHDAGRPSSLLFQDQGSSLATLPSNAVFGSSPLLTKSQMLPDSLLSDDVS